MLFGSPALGGDDCRALVAGKVPSISVSAVKPKKRICCDFQCRQSQVGKVLDAVNL